MSVGLFTLIIHFSSIYMYFQMRDILRIQVHKGVNPGNDRCELSEIVSHGMFTYT